MRPHNTLDSSLRPRKPSIEHAAAPTGPTAFFLTSESDLDRRASAASFTPDPRPVRTANLKETLEDSIQSKTSKTSPTRLSNTPRRDGSRRRSTIRPKSIEELRHEATRQQSFPSSQEPSLPSSPKSLSSRSCAKSEDDLTQDDSSSQAIESDDEPDHDADHTQLSSSLQDSAPQLIMPSIRIPSRRPFTDRGKQLGRLKIMVVGKKGTGKTSLIKSIVQLCEDIVHVDPLSTNIPQRFKPQSRSVAQAFSETHASTKPYPTWWSDTEESRILKRRKSMGDLVLERNICFVDSSHNRPPTFAVHYLEQQLLKTINSANQPSPELTALLCGRGGAQVDLILYLVSHDTLNDDCKHLQTLSQLANVVPLISKSDLLTSEQIANVKSAVSTDMSTIPHLPITFAARPSESPPLSAPYAISCVNGPDYDNMDASLLMASEYVQPLVPSELVALIDQIFQPENVSYLRHLAAKKLVSWYNSGSRVAESMRTSSPVSARVPSPAPSTLNSPLQASLAASGILVPVISHSDLSINTANSFALAKVADHTHREERLAQIRLSRWASDLQLSLQREREKYENIARSERAIWLVERMGEEIRDGQLVTITSLDAEEIEKGNTKGATRLYREATMTYQIHDPLGLLRWQDAVRAQGWLVLQVVGSLGVVGGLALFVTKTFGYETAFHQWARDWGIWRD